ncbi:YolD-like family protein [Oceanobacillus sp. J11TS1]|uniref:YolD-like family protein n=1 Tax=Oceanobacillus sp. J11TS1 TaxID=2807191 RepID=UPI001B1328F8|nr:YolD-like family protein [Oceanobacillus sp. J11TS1]GIO24796.1 hypothetical protein J11TS1_33770 [Oceanobacillus sp. J11TS1]
MAINKLTKGHNLRWESSRMMLPEHVSALNASRFDATKDKKPTIDEQQWEEYSLIIQEARANNRKVRITVWSDGFFRDMIGWIHSVDPQLKKIRIDLDEIDVVYINLDEIAGVETMD